MEYRIQDSDIALLRKTGVPEDDIKHCIKVAEKAADFVSLGGQSIPVEADYARLADGIEKASALMGGLYQRIVSLSQPQE